MLYQLYQLWNCTEVKASLYLGMSLGLTFPFNILIGVPLDAYMAQRFLQALGNALRRP